MVILPPAPPHPPPRPTPPVYPHGCQADSLSAAATNGDSGAIDECVASGCDVSAVDGVGWTPLLRACYHGHAAAARALLAHGADVNGRGLDSNQATPLYLAAQQGHVAVVKLLVRSGARVSAATSAGITPLYVACCKGYSVVAAALLTAGADGNAPVLPSGDTPLYVACQQVPLCSSCSCVLCSFHAFCRHSCVACASVCVCVCLGLVSWLGTRRSSEDPTCPWGRRQLGVPQGLHCNRRRSRRRPRGHRRTSPSAYVHQA